MEGGAIDENAHPYPVIDLPCPTDELPCHLLEGFDVVLEFGEVQFDRLPGRDAPEATNLKEPAAG
jgi:hypothetical protein